MRRDSIFYKLFQQYPFILFQLLENPPQNAELYKFDSVAVKEPKFEIDGVFLPLTKNPTFPDNSIIYLKIYKSRVSPK